jgi:hypothetical protein
MPKADAVLRVVLSGNVCSCAADTPLLCQENPYSRERIGNRRCKRNGVRRSSTASRRTTVAQIGIEEKKRGAPWVLILILLIVAAIIGWWLWSNRTSGEPTISTPAGAVADSAATTPAPTQ